MDRIKEYQEKIIKLLSPFENKSKGIYLITDTQHQHYQILRADWDSQIATISVCVFIFIFN